MQNISQAWTTDSVYVFTEFSVTVTLRVVSAWDSVSR